MKIWISAALMLWCFPLVAQEDVPQPPSSVQHAGKHKYPGPRQIALRMLVRHLLLQHYDTDKNGIITPDEQEAICQEARESMFKQAKAVASRFDTDHDGQLSPEERERMRQSRRGQRGEADAPPHHKKFHRFSDKKRPHRRHHRMGRKARMMAYISQQLLVKTYDKDKNGQLDAQEMEAYHRDAMHLYAEREHELLHRFDSDSNGDISAAEFQKAKSTLILPKDAEPNKPPHPAIPFGMASSHEDVFILFHLQSASCSRSTK